MHNPPDAPPRPWFSVHGPHVIDGGPLEPRLLEASKEKKQEAKKKKRRGRGRSRRRRDAELSKHFPSTTAAAPDEWMEKTFGCQSCRVLAVWG